jgi:hypothetical protein
MTPDEIAGVQLSSILRSEIALPLAQMLDIYTVGGLIAAWRSPHSQRNIERLFDSPEQARQAIAVCGGWLGISAPAMHRPVAAWWPGEDESARLNA